MRIASVVILVLTATIFSFWFFFVRAPGPVTVCDHIMRVTLAEAEAQNLSPDTQDALVERLREGCIQHKLDKIQLRGRIAYAEYARCVMSKNTRAEIDRC